ncbi:transcription antitermination factor NusB [Facklamia miroungae]|uniref:Transcription antitermination protein NusB n=1 Tax=Facklamia miroungae TaxID=120956 RepID=A0A1G7U300_9LACT|nr:transcription antitermination factor NusB [Facklamia miroungae]NKZ29887.1 transcription antitermination factor NusB [Facklamia miroungae]SDG41873.1 N utilization substance protein B [Facklamia miroungae]
MEKLSRHQLREKAVQSLYQLVIDREQFQSETAVEFALEAGNDPDQGFLGTIDPYLITLVRGVRDNQHALDDLIKQYLSQAWTLDRIASIDLTILRLAFFEVLFIDEEQVPAKVAVDEAIELAKTFSDDRSRKFISGVLAKLLAKQN